MIKKDNESLLSRKMFLVYFLVLLLMSGLHQGLVVLIDNSDFPVFIEITLPSAYWALVAASLTFYARLKMKNTYEKPMRMLAEATSKVASGDFSVYVPTIHTQEKYDYLDYMINDFNKMVAELGSIETLKTDFFSNVSHEIKTPLSVIQNNAELLQRKNITDEERNEYIENINYSTKRLTNLISNMLKLNKLEKQAIRPKREKYDLCRQLVDSSLQFEDIWDKKNIEFDVDIEESAFIEADEELMELVWTNLLSNAMKFTPNNGQILLKEETVNDEIIVTIKDSGCGMNEETIKHIFDKFYQGDTSHSTEGNGLGLALVKRILELSDARITVESKENQGSTFKVFFINGDK